MMIISFLIGSFFMMIFLLFTIAVILKIFVRYEYIFDLDRYEIVQYLRFFSYFKIRMRRMPFGEVDHILLSNYDSGNVLRGDGMRMKEWFTLDIRTDNNVVRLIRVEADEVEELNELYYELKDKLDRFFTFNVEFVEVDI
ncbi:MAG: hypothetical protein FH748_10430 [Balneolaceae bacterium]|nr:hypothetical protein [Balneolaceae bacterium]